MGWQIENKYIVEYVKYKDAIEKSIQDNVKGKAITAYLMKYVKEAMG